MLETCQKPKVLTKQESNGHGNNQQATLFDRGFVVGMFLGEGSVGFTRPTNKDLTNFRFIPRIRISNTDYALIQALHTSLNLDSIPHYIEKSNRTTGNKQSWNILMQGWKRVPKFIEIFRPLCVGTKRKQLDLLLELVNERFKRGAKEPHSEVELRLYEEIKSLNKQKVLRD